jgi:hypothetical protein
MVSKVNIVKVVFIVMLFCFYNFIAAVETQAKSDEGLALKYYKQENYMDALPIFKELRRDNPDDANINYYYGVCMVKNYKYSSDAKDALLKASAGNSPADALFYLANCFHAKSEWKNASAYYDRFAGTVKKKQVKAYGVKELMELCALKVNPFLRASGPEEEEVEKFSPFFNALAEAQIDAAKAKTLVSDDGFKVTRIQKKPILSDANLVEKLYTVWFDFQVNSQIKYHIMDHFRLDESKVLFSKGYDASVQYDTLISETDLLRDRFVKITDDSEKWEVAKEIIDAEQELYELMRQRDKLYGEARKLENSVWDNASKEDISKFNKRVSSDESRYKELLAAQSAKLNKIDPETMMKEDEAFEESSLGSSGAIENEAYSEPSFSENSIVYKVQIGAFINYVPSSSKRLFDNLSKFRQIESFRDNRGYIIYVVGKLSSYYEATDLKKQLRREGVNDAFVVAYKGKERITVKEALRIQNSRN